MASQKSNKGANSVKRTRNYATVVYPESAPENWQNILQEQLIPAFISPLHDKDINPTGEPKKAHYHVMIMYDSPKTEEQVKEVFAKIGGVGCEVVQHTRGYARYLCHLDNPEKVKYCPDDVISLCGAKYVDVIGDYIDRDTVLDEMCDFCKRYNVFSFSSLVDYARINRTEWSKVLKSSGTLYMREYLKSLKWSVENHQENIVDPETGEKIL